MTDDDICNLAVEHDAMSGDVGDLIKFARAVAAKEREACAAIVDVEMDEWGYGNMANIALNNVAAEIRARGEK